MTNAILETRDLTKCYGSFTAVDRLNLSVNPGEVFGLLGPNGAGKTTTTLMLLGLTEPSFGSAQIGGVDCTRNPLRVKRFVGYLPDNMGFYPDMTGRENLRMTGRMNGLTGDALERRIDELLQRVKMTSAADKRTGAYSKGMKQRLGIADILMKDPEVLIMDEPTNGIDPEGMRELMALIRELAEEDGKTILISSHQLHQIQQICDRVGIFVSGRLIACGRIDELAEQLPSEAGFRLEIAAQPGGEELSGFLEKQEYVKSVERSNDAFVIQTGADVTNRLLKDLLKAGFTPTLLRRAGNDLDEIYSRYFEKAGEQHAENSTDVKARVLPWKRRG
ncbi:MAG: ABC transporter ATP-binding protein [Candidatus Faecivicinus sp.]